MEVKIRKFKKEDIPLKVKWVNSNENNKYLHYDIPINEAKTLSWFESLSERTNRADFTIVENDIPVGLIGLLNIDNTNRKAELYILIGENEAKGKGVSDAALKLLLNQSKVEFNLNKVYLYTEEENKAAQNLFERCGFVQEGLLKHDLIYKGRKLNRLLYGQILNEDKDVSNANVQ